MTKAHRLAQQLEAGAVCINETIVSVANPYLPFGGVKNSGLGRYHGEIGLQIFTNQKSVIADSGKKNTEVNWFPYKGKLPLFNQLVRTYFGKKKRWFCFLKAYLDLLKKS
jgi:hypothetical protein